MTDETGGSKPKVSVVMPVYNAQSTVRSAIDSILKQTMSDFELIAIDDFSTDGSGDVVRAIADPRIRYVRNDKNLGVARSLNRGLRESRGDYIARMDSDDISLPNRLSRQLERLEADPALSICGTYADVFGEQRGRMEGPVDPEDLRCHLIFNNCFLHPTVMFRRDDFERNELRYEPIKHFEDYDLWQRAIGPLDGVNVPEVLLHYRVTSGSAMQGGDPAEQRQQYRAMDVRTLKNLGIHPGEEELALHHAVRRIQWDPFDLADVESWLLRLLSANKDKNIYPQTALKRTVGRLWFFACHYAPGLGLVKYSRLVKSPLFVKAGVPPSLYARFLLRFRPRRQKSE